MCGSVGAVCVVGGRPGRVTLVFRRATLSDVDRLHALIERAYRGESARQGWTHEADLLGGQRTDAPALAEGLGDPKRYMLVAEDEAELVACAELTDKGDSLAYIGLVTVEPARQGDGIGRAVLAKAERIAATTLSATLFEMTVIRQRIELIDWYQRRGYGATGEARPFPYGDARFGLPTVADLAFVVLTKRLGDDGLLDEAYDQMPRVS